MPLAILFLFIVSCGPKEPVSKEEQGENPIVKVSEVRVDETEAATLLTLSGDDEITFNVYKLDDANMVVIDLPDTRFTTPERKIELANELVSHVSLSEFSDQYSTLSRMSFFFNQTPVLPSIKEEGKQLQIRFAKEGGSLAGMEHFDDGGRDDFGRPAEETAKNIQEITCSVDQGLVTIRVRANARLDKYLEAFDRDHQDLSVEFPEVELAEGEQVRCAENPFILESSVGTKPAKLQFRTQGVDENQYALEPNSEGMVVSFFDPNRYSGNLTAVEYQQLLDYSRFTITTDKPVFFQPELEDERTVVLKLKNTVAPKRLRRIFDTSEFRGSVLALTPIRVPGRKELHLVTKLRSATVFDVSREGKKIHFDIRVTDADKRRKVDDGGKGTSGTLAVTTAGQDEEATAEEAFVEGEGAENTALAAGLEPEDLVEIDDSDLTIVDDAVLGDETGKASLELGLSGAPTPSRGTYAPVEEKIIGLGPEGGSGSTGNLVSTTGGLPKYTGRQISLNFENADIRYVLKLLADLRKMNFIFDDSVNGVVTVKLLQVPWDQALEVILRSKQLGVQDLGNILRVASQAVLQKEAEQALLNRSTEEKAKPLQTLLKPINYAKADIIAAKIKTMLEGKGTVEVDQRTNTLILTATDDQVEHINKIVGLLDTQTPQVLIEARIVEANTSFAKKFGINWSGGIAFSSAYGNPTGLFFPNDISAAGGAGTASGIPNSVISLLPGDSSTAVNLSFGSINGVLDIGLRLGMMEQWGHGKVISAPKVTVMDNEAATISSGFSVPFSSASANTGTNVQMIPANTSLTVTPHVTADGSILMEITASKDAPNFAQAVGGNPTIQTNQVNTVVLIKSGNTTVLGGHYEITNSESFEGVPLLSHIPVFGWLFKKNTTSDARKELLFFLTPRVVKDVRKAVSD